MNDLIIRKKLVLKDELFFRQHLEIVSAVLPVKLTDKEIDVLSIFMFKGNFSKESRKYVREKLNLSSASLSNYIRYLLNKGYIIRGNDDIFKFNNLIKADKVIKYNFELEYEDQE